MAVTIRSLDGGVGLLEVGTVILDGLQLMRAQVEFLTDERKRTVRYWLTDFSDVETSRTTSDQVLQLAQFQAERESAMPDVVVAIVVRLEVTLGLVQMWQMRLDSRGTLWETRVFHGRAEAEDWLRQRMREKHGLEIAFA